MALKSTIYKAELNIADMDRGVYASPAVTLALHPSETEERLMARLLAYALHLPADELNGTLQFAKGLSDVDEPDLWHKDYADQILHWIEVGQPDERRLGKASSRAERVTIVSYAASTPIWFDGLVNRISRYSNLEIWQLPVEQSVALSRLAQRSMRWQVSVQDGWVWVNSGDDTVEIQLQRLFPSA